MSVRRRFASPSTEKPRFLCLFQRKSPHNFCTKILHRTSCDRVGWSGCRLPQISPISTDKLHTACEESVFICRADGAICVIGKHPAWHLCSSVLSVGEIMYRMAHSPHSTLNTSRYRPPTASERVPICRADGAICVIGKHPAGICVPQCDLWAKKVPHGPFLHSTLNTSRYRPPTASERVPICRADGAICVIGKQPAWHLCSSVRSVGV